MRTVPWRVWRRAHPQRVPDGLSPFAWIRWGRYVPREDYNPAGKEPTMLPEPGTYRAKTANGVVYETEGGALMAAFDFGIDADHSIMGRVCLASKAGELQQNNLRSLREAFGWDGADPFWLADTDLSAIEVEIVVENEPDQNGNPRPTVRWINAPGRSHGGMPQSGDRKAILAKYGAKLRALAGGTTMRPVVSGEASGGRGSGPLPRVPATAQAAADTPALVAPATGAGASPQPAVANAGTRVQTPTTVAAATAPVRPGTRTSAPAVKPGNVQEAWEVFCQAAGANFDEAQISELWFKAVDELSGGKSQEKCSPEDWGVVRDGAQKWLANQLPM